jgi:hypothetical protein
VIQQTSKVTTRYNNAVAVDWQGWSVWKQRLLAPAEQQQFRMLELSPLRSRLMAAVGGLRDRGFYPN